MTPIRSKPDLPSVNLTSDNPLLTHSFTRALKAQGLETFSQSPSNSPSLVAGGLYAWIVNDLVTAAPSIIDLLGNSTTPGKVLIVFPFDSPLNSQAELSNWKEKINGYINEIIKISLQKQIDTRLVAHHALFDLNQVGEGSALTIITSSLKNGIIPKLSNQQLYPLHVDQISQALMRLWFDRGHRHQTVLLKGSLLPPEELTSFFAQLSPNPAQPITHTWSAGEGIVHQDMLEIKSDTSILYQNLASQFSLPAPKISPQSRPVEAPPLFEPPRAEPISVSAAPKNVVAAPGPKPWLKYIKYGLIALFSTSIAYIFVTYGLFAFSLNRAAEFNPSAGDELTEFSQNLQIAKSRYQKLVIFQSPNNYFDTRYSQLERSLRHSQAKHHGANALSMILGSQEGDPYKEISQAKLILDQLYELETKSQADEATIKTLESLRQMLTLYPQVIPENQKITILILFQNNLELRPTGGFIGSVGLATFDRGKLLNLETRNIYDLDANLRGIVAPPAEITEYLGESSWYFRDSNWNPDFVESAKSADWFLDKEWGSRADLVIGLNVNSLKQIVASLGSLTLTNGAAINPDNLLYTVLNSQDSPASTNTQPELLSLIASALTGQINQASAEVKNNVLQAIYHALTAGEITVSTSNDLLSVVLDDLRLSGTIYAPGCSSNLPAPCFADHFYLNEANVGINKANYYLSRQYDHQTTFSSGSILHTHKLNLQNTSPNNTWPAGSYKAYYRAYVPPTATDIVITVDDQALPADRLSFGSVPGFRIVGWFYELKAQSSAQLTLAYKLSQPPDLRSYQLFIQKQPGLLPGNFSYNFSGQNIPYAADANFDSHLTFPIKFSP